MGWGLREVRKVSIPSWLIRSGQLPSVHLCYVILYIDAPAGSGKFISCNSHLDLFVLIYTHMDSFKQIWYIWHIPHICHFLYTGRIFKFQILHLKITRIYPKKSKICIFLRSIWKNLHLTEFFTRAAPVVPVTNMRYGHTVYYKCIISIVVSVTQQQLCITLRISMYVIKR